jgi:Zn-dependent protease with chaperone function
MKWWQRCAAITMVALVASGCGVAVGGGKQPTASRQGGEPAASTRPVDSQLAARLRQVMVPLIQNMDEPVPLNQVRVGILDDDSINAANAGRGEFYVTTGLLRRASDDQLRAVMAHEIAHADLGHVAKMQTLGAGLNIGIILLDQIIPGSSALTPLAGKLVANAYGRKEEYAADAHGVKILRKAGHDGKGLMAQTLSWLQTTSGGGDGGGFFSTHPGTGDRIQAVQRLP